MILSFFKFILSILYSFCRFYTISITQFYRKRFFLEKKAPAGKFTHGKIFLGSVLKKKAPAGKLTHGKMFFVFFFFEKRPLRENADMAKNDLLIFSIFSRERNLYVSQMFTSDNYIFIRENTYFQTDDFYNVLILEKVWDFVSTWS